MDDDDWEVKDVVDVKFNKKTGGIEYQLEWENWDGDPTWEPEDNCACPDLILKFQDANPEKWQEAQRQRDRHLLPKTPTPTAAPDTTTIDASLIRPHSARAPVLDKQKNGFRRKAKLERIFAADTVDGYLVYVVKFEDSDEPEIIEKRSCIGKSNYVTQLILKFLEKRVTPRI